jgi:hypothetical protein
MVPSVRSGPAVTTVVFVAAVQRPGPAPARQQRKAAQADARNDGRAPADLHGAERVAEDGDAGDGADQRLEVEERPGDLGRHPALPEGEQRERHQRAERRQRADGQDRAGAGRDGRCALRDQGEGQGGHRGRQELHGGDRDRVAAGQQPDLRDGERSPDEQGDQHQPVAGQRRAAPAAAGDQADAAERGHEADPGHRAGHAVVPQRGDDRDQHRHGPDQQRRVGHAGPGDAGVLNDDRPAVPERARDQDLGRERGPQPRAARGQQDRGGQPETNDREPARCQPLQGQLGQRHGGTPQQPGRDEGCDGITTAVVHIVILTDGCTGFVARTL